jgi:hypothetical protein
MRLPARHARAVSPAESVFVDATVDCYVDWREEAAAVRAAYRRWKEAARADRAQAFAAYRAALDRESLAGDLYAAAIAYYLTLTTNHRRDA